MGEYRHTVDPKGRLIIPSRFRELLGAEFVVTRGLDGCLFVYPMDSWGSYVEELKKLRLDVPQATLLAYELQKRGIPLPDGILKNEELADQLCQLKSKM